MEYCMFCGNEAEYQIKGSEDASLCGECREVYEAGQENPEDVIVLATKMAQLKKRSLT